MTTLKALCLYCGSATPRNPLHRQAGEQLGKRMADSDIELVYGGARVGLMGITADACMAAGGRVTGIIPQHLQEYEVGHSGITKLHIVENMHTRKMLMFDKADAFAVLPGGYGTMDEFFEMLTWRQIQTHDKPIVLVNIDGYWNPLLQLMEHIIGEGYAQDNTRSLLRVVDNVDDIFPALAEDPPPRFDPRKKWL